MRTRSSPYGSSAARWFGESAHLVELRTVMPSLEQSAATLLDTPDRKPEEVTFGELGAVPPILQKSRKTSRAELASSTRFNLMLGDYELTLLRPEHKGVITYRRRLV